jgi:tRNA pseudouridine(38-40) synthase
MNGVSRNNFAQNTSKTMGILKRATATTASFFSLVLISKVNCYNQDSLRYRCRVAYNGAGFQGFQLQDPPARTVQGELEQVLTERFQQPVRVVGAGRTDAGVHARGQAFHFDLASSSPHGCSISEQELSSIEHSLNRMLRSDVRLWNLQRAPLPAYKTIGSELPVELAWNVMHDSTRKLYSYRISAGAVMEPLERHSRWHPDQAFRLDLDQLERLLKCYQGTHDFRAFAGAIEQLDQSIRFELSILWIWFQKAMACTASIFSSRVRSTNRSVTWWEPQSIHAWDACRKTLFGGCWQEKMRR